MLNSFIWRIDRTLSDAITPDSSGPGSDGYEEVFHILTSFSITGASPPDGFMSYQDTHCGEWPYPSADIQSVYSSALADGAETNMYPG